MDKLSIYDKPFDKMLAAIFIVAEKYQPSIIYIDEVHKIWKGKKKKGKKGKKGSAGFAFKVDRSLKAFTEDKKKLAKFKKSFKMCKEWVYKGPFNRIKIIGCTNEPQSGSEKDFKKIFDKSIFFPFPDYTTCRLCWKTFIEKLGGKTRIDFPLGTLALITHQGGFTIGAIMETCEFVLSPQRVATLDKQPLKIEEFIGPLSLRKNTEKNEYLENIHFPWAEIPKALKTDPKKVRVANEKAIEEKRLMDGHVVL